MKKFIRSMSVLVSIVLGLFWTVGLFAVEKTELPLLIAVAVITESIPVLLAVLMKKAIRKGDKYAQAAKVRASVPIWEKGGDEKSSAPTTKADVAETTPAPVVSEIVIPEIPAESEPDKAPEPMKPTEPPAECPETDDDKPEESPEKDDDRPEESVDDEKNEVERLRRTMTRAVNEAVELHGFAYAVHMSKVAPEVAKGLLTVYATGCQKYDGAHPMYRALAPILASGTEFADVTSAVWKLTGDYMFACGADDPYLELKGMLRGFAATSCAGKVFRPVLEKWVEDRRIGRRLPPFDEVEKILKRHEGQEGIYSALRSVADYKIEL